MTSPVIFQVNADPNADNDYDIDWAPFLALAAGDSLSTSTWSVTPTTASPLQLHTPSVVGTKAITWIKGGLLGTNYAVVNHVVTTQGRTEDQTVMVYIQQH